LREAWLFDRGVFGAESRRGYSEIANAVFLENEVADVCGDRYPTSLLCVRRQGTLQREDLHGSEGVLLVGFRCSGHGC